MELKKDRYNDVTYRFIQKEINRIHALPDLLDHVWKRYSGQIKDQGDHP